MISNTRFWGIRPDYVILHYYIGGVIEIYYNITMGGGVSRDPKFVLRNIWTAPKWVDLRVGSCAVTLCGLEQVFAVETN